MAKTVTIPSVSSGYLSDTQINNNFGLINENFENFLHLDGLGDNALNTDLDLNSNDILNGGSASFSSLTLNGQSVVALSSTPDWEGAWLTATSYAVNDLVRQDGNVYICLEAHTSGTFATDLSALKWELFASKGSAGAGTGDMLAANNLSDVGDTATAIANLGAEPADVNIAKTDVATVWSEDLSVVNNKLRFYNAGSAVRSYLIGYSTGGGAIGLTDNTNTLLAGTKTNCITWSATTAGPSGIAFWDQGAQAAYVDPAGPNEATIDDSIITREKITPSMKGRTGWELVETTYDSSVDGVVASTESADFSDGYEYKFVVEGVGHNSGSSRQLQVEIYKATDTAYHSTALPVSASVSNTAPVFGEVEFSGSRDSRSYKDCTSSVINYSSTTPGTDSGQTSTSSPTYKPFWTLATGQAVGKVRFSWTSGSLDAGSILMYRKPVVT